SRGDVGTKAKWGFDTEAKELQPPLALKDRVPQVHVWDGADGDELKEARATPSNGPGAVWSGPMDDLAALSYSPDGKLLAVYRRGASPLMQLTAAKGAKLRLLDAATGEEVRVLKT